MDITYKGQIFSVFSVRDRDVENVEKSLLLMRRKEAKDRGQRNEDSNTGTNSRGHDGGVEIKPWE